MVEAGLWGLVGGVALLLGAAIGLWLPTGKRVVGLVMAFGSGVLISALAFDLTEEAFSRGGLGSVAGGMAAGAVSFLAGDWIIDRRGAEHRKRSGGQQSGGSAGAIVLGSLMDGIPESVAIGVSLVGGGPVAAPVVVAVFLSNVPESLAAAKGLTAAGHSTRYILCLWSAVALLSAAAAATGFALLGDASGFDGGGHPGLRRRRHPHHAGRHHDARGVRARGTGCRTHHRARVRPCVLGLDRRMTSTLRKKKSAALRRLKSGAPAA